MQTNTIFEEVRTYSEKFGTLLHGLSKQDSKFDKGYSEREVILHKNKLTLYHYLAPSKKRAKMKSNTPVLIVYALVNRPTILDLEEKHSAIAKMLEQGQDVYLIDWGYPDKSDKELGLNDYINDQLHSCVTTICQNHSIQSVNLLGVCQGGALSLCYSSFYPDFVKNLITMVTPVDFHTDNDTLSRWVRHVDIDLMVNTLGNIPGSILSNAFLSLKPFQLQLKKYLDLIETTDLTEDNSKRISNFLLMERWIFDCPDQAGEAFRHYVQSCYQDNELIKGEFSIAGKTVNLERLQMPILNIYAEQDHIVPPEASRGLKGLTRSADYQEMSVSGGHIGIFVSPKYIDRIFPAVCRWLEDRD
jgi:polyhydroxyalkanoate synthase